MPTQRITLTHGDVPKSLNDGGVGARQHWGVAARQKKEWGGIWLALLLKSKVAKRAEHVRVEAHMDFYFNQRHDPDNYTPGLLKPLLDTLVTGGYIPDDTQRYVTFEDLTCAHAERPARGHPKAKGATTVVLTLSYGGDDA